MVPRAEDVAAEDVVVFMHTPTLLSAISYFELYLLYDSGFLLGNNDEERPQSWTQAFAVVVNQDILLEAGTGMM